MESLQRVLYVDAYDSFANNIVGLLEIQLKVEVTVVRIDNPTVARDLKAIISSFDAIVVGPGPGHPAIPQDVGFIDQLWQLEDKDIIPIFGICLGFQSLALAFGADVKRMRSPRHGIVSNIVHSGTDIFHGVCAFEATQYHSLYAHIGHSMQSDAPSMGGAWNRSSTCPELQPLAWEVTDKENGPVLMSVKHTGKPFWGVQFHPESICTAEEGHKMIAKWWSAAQTWSTRNGRIASAKTSPPQHILPGTPSYANRDTETTCPLAGLDAALLARLPGNGKGLLWSSHALGITDVVDICEAMGIAEDEIVLLDSQGHQSGRFSIMGLIPHGKTVKFSYTVHDKRLQLAAGGQQAAGICLESIDGIWPLLQMTLDRHAPVTDVVPHVSPFWGGWMGYISYEVGLETLEVSASPASGCHTPDLNFAFIERSIVLDHHEQRVYVQSLSPDDNLWLLETGKLIDSLSGVFHSKSGVFDDDGFNRMYQVLDQAKAEDKLFEGAIRQSYIDRPYSGWYCRKVLQCQEFLAAGDSYELCLTDETKVLIPRTKETSLSPWVIYKKLRKNNPAPFGAYIRLPNTSIVGSSPERFLRWTRDGRCQFRPIKGTVKKTPEVDFAAASEILNSSKERAENLMIVDLIRHDLSGVIGTRSCTVPKLMQIEEYKTVYQLVSVIEGQIPGTSREKASVNETAGGELKASTRGLDVLKASLPPGSMTGAPKKRSCEILAELENRPRGIYSGVVGYLDVGGGGDFSVVIRTATKWDNDYEMRPAKAHTSSTNINDHKIHTDVPNGAIGMERTEKEPALVPHDVWRIGAGGAVTIQSTAEGEFAEMETKLDSVLRTFQV